MILSVCTLRKGSFMDSACKSPTLLAEVMANKKVNFRVRNLSETSSRGSNGCIDNASNTLVKSQGGQLHFLTGETLSLANKKTFNEVLLSQSLIKID